MSESVIRLSFPAKADYLLLARLTLSGLARSVPFDPELLADLKLAVTEACGNAVKHAYDDSGGPVNVAFVTGPDRLEMIVEDEGTGLDPSALPDWDAERGLDSGMGMSIIRAIVDDLDVRAGSDGRGTVVHMTKYLGHAV